MRFDAHPRAFEIVVDQHLDEDAVAGLDLGHFVALLVEQINGGLAAGAQYDAAAAAAARLVLEHAKRRQARRGGGAHQAAAVAMRARLGRGFEHAGAQALAAHLHQAERADPAHLDTGAVVLQRVFHRLLDFADMPVRFHVDEVDDDQAGHVAQAELASDFVRRFDVRRISGLLDIMLAGRAAGVDVDRDQGLGRVDHHIAAGLQLDERLVHGAQLVLCPEALEERHRVDIFLHLLHVARHQQFHELPGVAIAVRALDDHLVDILVVDVADGALDEVAVLIDQGRRFRLQRVLADLVPEAGEIVEVALDLDLGARQAGGANDAAHGRRQGKIGHDLLQPLAVGAVGNLPADAAAMRRVGHQHAIAAGEAEIGGEGRALVAALFLHDLNEQHLAAPDHVLDLVAAAQILALAAQGLGRALLGGALGLLRRGRRGVVAFAGLFAFIAVGGQRFGLDRLFLGLDIVAVVIVVALIFGGAQALFLGGVLGLFTQKRLAILLGDLVIIGVDLAEGQEAVAVAAIIDKRRLERGLHARHLGKIDIPLELLVLGGFEIKFLDPVSLEHRHPSLLLVARVDQHAHGH